MFTGQGAGMKAAGYLLIVAGFLAGAYFASLDPDATDWLRFLPSAAVAAVGVLLVKRAGSAHARSDAVLEGNRRDLGESLAAIVERLEALNERRERIPPWEMRFEIDRSFRGELIRFADARESLAHLYGLQAYADVMSEFAAGERYLNRVWSASADGYVDEVMMYLERALTQFRAAQARLAQVTGA